MPARCWRRRVAPIGADETSDDVERDLARLGAPCWSRPSIDSPPGRVDETPQDDAAATYAHRLTKDDGVDRLDAGRPTAIHNLIRGLHPWPHAFTFLGDKRLILLRSTADRPTPLAASLEPSWTSSRAIGCVVATGDGLLRLLELQAEGKRPMPAREFLAGHPRAPGRRFRSAGMIAPARVAAYDILRAVSAGSADLPAAIAAIARHLHDDRDRALAAEIATRRRSAGAPRSTT